VRNFTLPVEQENGLRAAISYLKPRHFASFGYLGDFKCATYQRFVQGDATDARLAISTTHPSLTATRISSGMSSTPYRARTGRHEKGRLASRPFHFEIRSLQA